MLVSLIVVFLSRHVEILQTTTRHLAYSKSFIYKPLTRKFYPMETTHTHTQQKVFRETWMQNKRKSNGGGV